MHNKEIVITFNDVEMILLIPVLSHPTHTPPLISHIIHFIMYFCSTNLCGCAPVQCTYVCRFEWITPCLPLKSFDKTWLNWWEFIMFNRNVVHYQRFEDLENWWFSLKIPSTCCYFKWKDYQIGIFFLTIHSCNLIWNYTEVEWNC